MRTRTSIGGAVTHRRTRRLTPLASFFPKTPTTSSRVRPPRTRTHECPNAKAPRSGSSWRRRRPSQGTTPRPGVHADVARYIPHRSLELFCRRRSPPRRAPQCTDVTRRRRTTGMDPARRIVVTGFARARHPSCRSRRTEALIELLRVEGSGSRPASFVPGVELIPATPRSGGTIHPLTCENTPHDCASVSRRFASLTGRP